MIKAIIGLLLCILGGYGWIWWNKTLKGMGGPDVGRSVAQYDVPYFITGVVLLIGLFLFLGRYVY
jgi:hypothetical protein